MRILANHSQKITFVNDSDILHVFRVFCEFQSTLLTVQDKISGKTSNINQEKVLH